ncbi:MAG: hypothetical protein JU82_06265 [Sulfuricurvum sp. MLSB]|uniref:hypothetical protein n=1 Tax=unclassified Sulfuricurvum TaxID=2632390 RepID=UPI0005055AC8|nr:MULTISPECIES: hypothetical protein [unclassified Sulfuricurvum]KFN39686.1 MAG: hypothetical protein JU82_06265 [Sulfuricurvum sp. MLSB]
MLESMYSASIQDNLSQHINSLIEHRSYYERNIDTLADNEEVVKRIMLLNASHVFFEDLLHYHPYMNFTNAMIDSMVIKMDDLIDEFEPLISMTSQNELIQQYFDKAAVFYDLLVRAQVELGFYKVER